jgi:hypothetical protein
MVDPVCGADYQARALLLALDLGEPMRVGRGLAIEAIYLASQGHLGRARSLAGDAADIASRRNDPYLDALARAADGIVAYYACEYAEAAALLSDAERRFQNRTTGTAWELCTVRMFRLGALATIGLYAELDRHVDEYLRDAERRDDRYTEATMLRMFNVVWLVRGEPAEARRMLDARRWTPPSGSFHLQHFFEVTARVDIDLYEGNAATTRERLGPMLHALEHSLLMRLQTARAMACWLLARLALAEDDDEAAEAYARKLDREGLPTTAVCALLLRATLATRARDDAEALGALDEAIAIADAEGFLLWAAVGRRRRGELVGGDEGSALVHEADLWMEGQGIKSPPRFAAFVIPPFRSYEG